MLLARHCEYCGQPMMHYKDKQKYHKECKEAATRKQQSEYWYRKKSERPPILCQMCGKDITKTKQRKYGSSGTRSKDKEAEENSISHSQ